MSWETARRAIDFSLDEARRQGQLRDRYAVAQIGYFGGEPLLEWELLTRSATYAGEVAESRGVVLGRSVTTNMTLLDEPRVAWLVDQQFHVGLSLDGGAQRHNLLRRMVDGSASHDRCMPGLRAFARHPGRCAVIMVIDPRNVCGLAESLAWLVDQGMRKFILNPNFHAVWEAHGLACWTAEMTRLGDLLVTWYRAGCVVAVDVLDSKIEARIRGVSSRCGECGFGGTEMAIAPSGAIYPCVRAVGDDADKELCIGNVYDGFDSAKRARVLALPRITHDECGHCSARERCDNWCACVNRATTGHFGCVSGLVCHHEKTAITVADEMATRLFGERNPAFMQRFYQNQG